MNQFAAIHQMALDFANTILVVDSYAGSSIKLHWSDTLVRYPWIKSIEHLQKVNKYRRRHGQRLLEFNDDDMAELALTSRS